MEELAASHSVPCGDLERLAAAAATVGYSSSLHGISEELDASGSNDVLQHEAQHLSTQEAGLSSAIIHCTDVFEVPRAQSCVAVKLADFQSKILFDPNHQSENVMQQTLFQSVNSLSQRLGSPHYTDFQPSDTSSVILPASHNIKDCTESSKLPSMHSTGLPSGHYFPTNSRNIALVTNTMTVQTSQMEIIEFPNYNFNAHSVIQFVPREDHPNKSETQHSLTQSQSEGAVPLRLENSLENESDKSYKSKAKCIKTTKKKNKYSEKNIPPKLTDVNIDVLEPVKVDGKKYLICPHCNAKFLKKNALKKHMVNHNGDKRGALSLERKVDIIKKVKNGEKQVNVANEYNIGRSTLSFIVKNADKFLNVFKDGTFHPNSKRLRGPQREDVEAALYEWYKQATIIGMPVSGPILCRKARDFASKLGYQEFKATHGWLDRFKHRKKIMLNRIRAPKEKAEQKSQEFQEDFTDVILPSLLAEYESNNVFYASEIGLLYNVHPSEASQFKGTRCAGGTNCKRRITVLLCTNMNGTEKFPLLIIGKSNKPKCFHGVKSLPVQYLANEKSWITKEIFNGWLEDLNSWFSKENRKVLLLVPDIPIHPKEFEISAIKVVVSPSCFVGPSKLGISHALKRNYRRFYLESLLEQVENNKRRKVKQPSLKVDLLDCLHKLAASWHAVTDITIYNSFQRSALGKFIVQTMNFIPETILGTENLSLIMQLKNLGVKIPDSFTFDDFVTFDDNVQVCHYMDDDDIIAAVTGADAESSESEDDFGNNEEKNPTDCCNESETVYPLYQDVERSLQVLRSHINFQMTGAPGVSDILITRLEYLLKKTR